MTNPIDAILGNRRREPSMAQVISTDASEGSCTVLLADGEVDARLADHLLLPGPTAAVVPGDVVALLPIGDTYLVVASVGSSAGAGGTAPSLGSNLLPNPGFEFGSETPDGWGAWPFITDGVTASRDTTPGESLSGSASVRHTLPASSGPEAFGATWTSAALTVDAGTTYRISAWVRASAVAPGLSCQLLAYTGATSDQAQFFGGGALFQVATVAAPGSAYQLILGDVTIPAGHGFARLHLRSVSTHPAPLTVSWDEAAFQQRIT